MKVKGDIKKITVTHGKLRRQSESLRHESTN